MSFRLESKITQYYCKEKNERFDLVLNTRLVPFLYVISSNFSFPEKKKRKKRSVIYNYGNIDSIGYKYSENPS